MNAKVIINPQAGRQLRDFENKIRSFFKDTNITLNFSYTDKKGHATKIAQKTKDNDLIIIVGGDGTINEVVNGLRDYKVKIGLIPVGSENVFATELKIPKNVKKACEIILKGRTRKIDLGVINKKKFIFVAGIGFDAHAITKIRPKLKKLIGKHSYKIAGLETLFKHKAEELTIKIGKKTEKGYFVLASNVKNYGGNFKITPKAKLDDGYLDICIFQNKDVWSVMKYVVGGITGHITRLKDIKHYQVKKATITSEKAVLYHTDAELGGKTPVEIKVLAKKLKIITP